MSDLQSEYNSIQDSKQTPVHGMRAKFRCIAKLPTYNNDTVVHLGAVYSSEPSNENKVFCDATPSAHLQMQISAGKPAADLFVIGQEYYLDFTPVTYPDPCV